MKELTIAFDAKQLELYRCGDPACIYQRWPLTGGRAKWGEFPPVVAREHYREMGYTVLASEPLLPDGEGFILVSYPDYRRTRHPAYTRMAELLGTDLEALDALNRRVDEAKKTIPGNSGGGDPDLFVYKPDGSEQFFVEVKHKDKLNRKQLITFPILSEYWEVKIVRIVES